MQVDDVKRGRSPPRRDREMKSALAARRAAARRGSIIPPGVGRAAPPVRIRSRVVATEHRIANVGARRRDSQGLASGNSLPALLGLQLRLASQHDLRIVVPHSLLQIEPHLGRRGQIVLPKVVGGLGPRPVRRVLRRLSMGHEGEPHEPEGGEGQQSLHGAVPQIEFGVGIRSPTPWSGKTTHSDWNRRKRRNRISGIRPRPSGRGKETAKCPNRQWLAAHVATRRVRWSLTDVRRGTIPRWWIRRNGLVLNASGPGRPPGRLLLWTPYPEQGRGTQMRLRPGNAGS